MFQLLFISTQKYNYEKKTDQDYSDVFMGMCCCSHLSVICIKYMQFLIYHLDLNKTVILQNNCLQPIL
jgi:hypothetical protein